MEAFDKKPFSGDYGPSTRRRVAGNMGNATPPVKSLPQHDRVPMPVEWGRSGALKRLRKPPSMVELLQDYRIESEI